MAMEPSGLWGSRVFNRRTLMKLAGIGSAAAALGPVGRAMGGDGPERLNLLLITADDLNCNSVGVFGGKVAVATPNIDRLAAEGMRFQYAHVTVGVCQPSRNVLMTGCYPHHTGGLGFNRITNLQIVTLWEHLAKAGYRTGLMAKVPHCLPKPTDKPDMVVEAAELGMGRDPKLYHKFARQFMADAAKAGKPFFLMANSQDPHRPYSGSDQEKKRWGRSQHRAALADLPARRGRRARLPARPAGCAARDRRVLQLRPPMRRHGRPGAQGPRRVRPAGQHARDVPVRQRHRRAVRQDQLLPAQHAHALAGPLAGPGQGGQRGRHALHLRHRLHAHRPRRRRRRPARRHGRQKLPAAAARRRPGGADDGLHAVPRDVRQAAVPHAVRAEQAVRVHLQRMVRRRARRSATSRSPAGRGLPWSRRPRTTRRSPRA